jgi:hypothetical protein
MRLPLSHRQPARCRSQKAWADGRSSADQSYCVFRQTQSPKKQNQLSAAIRGRDAPAPAGQTVTAEWSQFPAGSGARIVMKKTVMQGFLFAILAWLQLSHPAKRRFPGDLVACFCA